MPGPPPTRSRDVRRARVRDALILAFWLVLCASPVWLRGGMAWPWLRNSDPAAIFDREHRWPEREIWLVLGTRDPAPSDSATDRLDWDHDPLARAPRSFARAFGPEYRPMNPPAIEARRWLDEHREWRIDPGGSGMSQFMDTLEDRGIDAAIATLRARMSTLGFGLVEPAERRDPLGIERFVTHRPGGHGFVDFETKASRPPVLDADGAARSADGRHMLIRLVSDRPVSDIQNRASEVARDLELTLELHGPAVRRAEMNRGLDRAWPKNCLAVIMGIAGVLALSIHRLRRALALTAGIATCVPLAVASHGGLDLWSWPLTVAVMIMAGDHLIGGPTIARRRWTTPAIWASTCITLAACNYPAWNELAGRQLSTCVVAWFVIFAAFAAAVQLLGATRTSPAGVEGMLRGDGHGWLDAIAWPQWWGPRSRPWLACVTGLLIAAGFVALYPELRVRGTDRDDPSTSSMERLGFFDPRARVFSETGGNDPARALARARTHVESLHELDPATATRIDGPATYILDDAMLRGRALALQSFALPDRLSVVRARMEAAGLHADAFADAFGSAWHDRPGPSAQRLLESELGDWARNHASQHSGQWWMRSYLQLSGSIVRDRASASKIADNARFAHSLTWSQLDPRPAARTTVGSPVGTASGTDAAADAETERSGVDTAESNADARLRGPTIADWRIRVELPGHFAQLLGLQLTLAFVIVWAATRCVPTASVAWLTGALAGLTTVIGLHVLGVPLSPVVLPALSVGIAGSCLGAARSCRARVRDEQALRREWFGPPACLVLSGMSLAFSGVEVWTEIGWAFGVAGLSWAWLTATIAPGLFTCIARWTRTEAQS